MNTRQIVRVTLSIVVLGSLLGLIIYAGLADMEDGVQAPLFALITATGLAVVLGPRVKQRWERVLNLFVQVAIILAAVLSAYHGLLSENAGTGIELVGAGGALLAGIAFMVNFGDVEALIEKQDHYDDKSD